MKQILFIATLLSSFAANAANFSFTGNLAKDSDHILFSFTVSEMSTVAIRTFGFAGGTNSAWDVIPAGGFDPMIALFDSDGMYIAMNDDCTANLDNNCDDVNADVDSYGFYLKADSLLDLELEEGDYTAALGFYGQDLSQMPSLSEIIWTGGYDFDGRSNFWALDISGDHVTDASVVNPSQVPVPAAVWLFGSALLGLTGMKRKSA